MTPAIRMVKKAGIPFETRAYPHDPRTESYGAEAATLLGVPPDWVFKTLIVQLDNRELIGNRAAIDGIDREDRSQNVSSESPAEGSCAVRNK